MLQNFEVITPLFEGQVNERLQFKLNIKGNDYRGFFHKEEVHWFQPPPYSEIEKDKLHLFECNVRDLISSRLIK